MRRRRTNHEQQNLFKAKGGRRRGAGRPPKGPRSSEKHQRRPKHVRSHPVFITLRVVEGLGSLRKRDTYRAIREATLSVVGREDFRIVYFSIQTNHIHMIIESENKTAIARGMQAFEISAAKHINRAVSARRGKRRRGSVFGDRYHARALTSPRSVRHALSYVLNNWRKHQQDRFEFSKTWLVDPYSNGVDFPGWKELADSAFLYKPPATYVGLFTWLPKTWLLKTGWQKHGLISVREVPSSGSKPA